MSSSMEIREANFSDLESIWDGIMYEAEEEHFSPILLWDLNRDDLTNQLVDTVKTESCSFLILPSGRTVTYHSFMLVVLLNGEVAGFSWVLQKGKKYELYLMSIYPDFRGRKLSKPLIKASLKRIPKGKVVFVRTYPKSTLVREILKSMGFNIKRWFFCNDELIHMQIKNS